MQRLSISPIKKDNPPPSGEGGRVIAFRAPANDNKMPLRRLLTQAGKWLILFGIFISVAMIVAKFG